MTEWMICRNVAKGGQKTEWYVGLFVADASIYQVLAFADQKSFPHVKDDLRAIIDSFQVQAP